jgi:hypothetical protein
MGTLTNAGKFRIFAERRSMGLKKDYIRIFKKSRQQAGSLHKEGLVCGAQSYSLYIMTYRGNFGKMQNAELRKGSGHGQWKFFDW